MKPRSFDRIVAAIYFTLMIGLTALMLVMHSRKPGGLNFGDGMFFGVILCMLVRAAFQYARTGSI